MRILSPTMNAVQNNLSKGHILYQKKKVGDFIKNKDIKSKYIFSKLQTVEIMVEEKKSVFAFTNFKLDNSGSQALKQ